MRWLALVLLGACSQACSQAHSPADGGAALDAPPDSPVLGPDSGTGCPVAGEILRFYELGLCFEGERCCDDRDCEAAWRCSVQHRVCVPDDIFCNCASDADCDNGIDDVRCISNEVLCGACVIAPGACTLDTDCAETGFCAEDGYCADPNADCRMPEPGP